MIKTLRITSIVATILAAAFFVFSVVVWIRSDEQVFLFSIKPEFQSDLDNGTISEELRQEFEGSYSPLPQHAAVSVKEAGSKWLITDKLKKYSISKAERGLRIYEPFEQFLNSPGVIEKFNKAVGNKATRSRDETSPLVQQAGAFALYLNPPTPKAPRTPTGRGALKARGPDVTPKFKVLGTSYYKERPESSLALIDEPGKGLHWVRQSGKIRHLLIEQIKDGLIVVKDNGRIYEVAVEQKPETSLLEGASAGVSSQAPDAADTKSTSLASRRTATSIRETGSDSQQPQLSTGQEEKLNELIEKLQEIQRSYKSDKTGSGPSTVEKAAMMEKLITKFKSSRLSAEEAASLGNLGRDLQDVWEDTSRSGSEKNKDN